MTTSRSISPSFARYWRADAVSGLGTYVTLFALQALVVLTLDGTSSDVGWMNAARWLPYLLFGFAVGAWVDGRRRLPLMVASDLAQGLLLMLIPLLWWLDVLTLPGLLAIVFAYGTAAVINFSAGISFLPRIVEPRQLQAAHARVDGTEATASMAGPALGGALVGMIGAPLTVLIDSATYLFSALTLRRIEHDEPPPRTGVTARGMLRDVREGIGWVYRGVNLAALAISTHAWFVGNAIVGVVLAPYVLLVLDLSAFQFGLIGAAGGVGAVLGALITTWVGRSLGTGWTIITCHAITTIGVVVMVAAGTAPAATMTLVMVGQGFYGLALGMSNSHEMSYRQAVTPDELQARSATTMRTFNRTTIVVVAPIAGIVADAWGIRNMLVVAAVVFALVTVGLALTPFRRAREDD